MGLAIGRMRPDTALDDLVVSDPIRNAAGQVIGAVTVGHPSHGLSSLREATAVYITLSALLCWILVLAGSALSAKRWALPIGDLSRLAKRISEAETINTEHLALAVEAKTLELRTPLNSIIGFSDMLTGGIYGDLTEPQRQRVEIIGDSARYLLQLINDLLDVSRIDQGKLALEQQAVSVAELVESVLAIIRSNCEQSGINIRVEQAAELPPIWVDPVRIKQVLYNVLSNAVKFTSAGGAITVALGARPDGVSVAVTDTGIGISTDDQLYVFDEFFQGGNIGERKQAATGSGVIKRIEEGPAEPGDGPHADHCDQRRYRPAEPAAGLPLRRKCGAEQAGGYGGTGADTRQPAGDRRRGKVMNPPHARGVHSMCGTTC